MTGKERADFVARMRGQGKEQELMSGTVVAGSVNENEMTCSVEVLWQDEPIEGVLLNVIDSNVGGVCVVPADGSNVWIGSIDGPGEWGIFKTETIKKILVDVTDLVQLKVKELSVDCDGSTLGGKKDEWAFNGGKNGGLAVVNKLVKRMNKAEDALSDLITKYNAHTHPYTDTPVGAAVTLVTTGASTKVVTQTKDADIENKKVKH